MSDRPLTILPDPGSKANDPHPSGRVDPWVACPACGRLTRHLIDVRAARVYVVEHQADVDENGWEHWHQHDCPNPGGDAADRYLRP